MENNSSKSNIEINKAYEEESIFVNNGTLTEVDQYLREIGNIPLLSPEEEYTLAKRVISGDKNSKQKFINSNLKLVVSIAKKYIGCGVDFLDLIQEGNLGLMIALDRFDPDKGFKFSTYATPWIMSCMQKAIFNSKGINLPRRLSVYIQKYKQTKQELTKKLYREPTGEEIAKAMGITNKKLIEIEIFAAPSISLNSYVGEKKDSEFEDFIESSSSSPEEIVIESRLSGLLMDVLDKCNLTEMEREVLLLRNGFKDNPKTLVEIAEIYGLSHERIRQLESRALRKIKNSKYISELTDYSNSDVSYQKIKVKNRKA